MKKHEHKECSHKLRHCEKCDVIYCASCGKEWGGHKHPFPRYPYEYPYRHPWKWEGGSTDWVKKDWKPEDWCFENNTVTNEDTSKYTVTCNHLNG